MKVSQNIIHISISCAKYLLEKYIYIKKKDKDKDIE